MKALRVHNVIHQRACNCQSFSLMVQRQAPNRLYIKSINHRPECFKTPVMTAL